MRIVPLMLVLLGILAVSLGSCSGRNRDDRGTLNSPSDNDVFDSTNAERLGPYPATVTLATCTGGPAPTSATQTLQIDSTGGAITRGRVRLRVLPLAFRDTRTFQVGDASGAQVGISVEATPTVTFSPQAVMSIRTSGCGNHGMFYIVRKAPSGWEAVPRQWRIKNGNLVSAYLDSLSQYALASGD